jgi:hypothetical protein
MCCPEGARKLGALLTSRLTNLQEDHALLQTSLVFVDTVFYRSI